MRTKYSDLPEPEAKPCPVRPEVVAKIRAATLIVHALWKTGEEYHAGAIDHAEFGRRNREAWDRAEREQVTAEVKKQLRDSR